MTINIIFLFAFCLYCLVTNMIYHLKFFLHVCSLHGSVSGCDDKQPVVVRRHSQRQRVSGSESCPEGDLSCFAIVDQAQTVP